MVIQAELIKPARRRLQSVAESGLLMPAVPDKVSPSSLQHSLDRGGTFAYLINIKIGTATTVILANIGMYAGNQPT